MAQSYGCLSEVPPLLLQVLSLSLEGLPLLLEALLLLQHVAVVQQGRRLLVAWRAQLLLQGKEENVTELE